MTTNGFTPSGRTARPDTMTRRQRLVLVLLLASQFMLAVDFSILNVALPTVGAGLDFADADLQWIATAFALCAAGFTLLFGRVGDYVGRRWLFLIGMSALGAASLLGGLAVDPAVLLTARVLQGLATAAVTPAALSLLTTAFAEGPLRAKALGLNSVMMSTGFTAGAILGGVLTDLLGWRFAFLVNVPVALLVLAVAPTVLTDTAARVRSRLDVPGSVLVTTGLLALVFGATRAGERGIGDGLAIGSLAAAAVLLVLFWRVENRHPFPLVPTAILRRRSIRWGNVAGLTTFAMESALVFLLTMYLQHVLGFNPLQTGGALGAMGAGAIIGGSIGPRVIAAIGVRRTLVSGLLVQGGLTALLVLLGGSAGWVLPLLVLTFLGAVGHVAVIVGFMVAATSGLPDQEQGLATGLATMTQQVGIALGVPIVSAVATGVGTLHSLSALRTAVAVDAALVLVVAALIAFRMRSDAPAAAATDREGESVQVSSVV
jgi:MFS family permease